MSDFPLGQPIRLGFETFSDPEHTTPADPSTVTYTIQTPDGTVETYTWADADIVRAGEGDFYYDYTPATTGHYELRQVAAGLVEAVRTDAFDVVATYSQVISVTDIRDAALNKTLPNDDREIQRMLSAALAAYADHVGPLPGERTEYFDGGGTRLILSSPNATEIVSAEYDSGDTITVSDLTVRNGIVGWGYSTAGRFTYGAGNLAISYVVGSLPAHHREAIIADVAGYFAATQRGGGAGPSFASEGYEAPLSLNPLVLFPRIMALAGPGIA